MRTPLSHRLPNAPAVFVGREAQVARFHDALERGPVAVVVGAGGMGKSALVRRALQDEGSTPGHCFVVAVRPGDDVVDALVTLGRLLAPDDSARWVHAGSDRDALLEAVLELAELSGATIVIEDLHHATHDPASILVALASFAARSQWVFTGRNTPQVPELAEQIIRLAPLDEASARALAERCGVDPDAIDEVLDMAGGSPLAIRQGAAGGASMAALDNLSPAVVPLLQVLATVSQPLSQQALGRLAEVPDAAQLAGLEEAGWIERDGDSQTRLHDVVRELLASVLSSEQRAMNAARAASELPDLGEEGALMEGLSSAIIAGLADRVGDLLERHGDRLLIGGRGLWLWRHMLGWPEGMLPGRLTGWALKAATVTGSPETLAWAAGQPRPTAPEAIPLWLEALLQFGRHAQVVQATDDLTVAHPQHESLCVKRARGLTAVGRSDEAMQLLDGLECDDPVNAAHRDAYLAKALMLEGDYDRAAALSRALQSRIELLPPLERDAVDVERAQVVVALGGKSDTESLFGHGSPTGTGRRRAHLLTAVNALLAGRRQDAEDALTRVEELGSPFDRIVQRMLEAGLAVLDGDEAAARAGFDSALEDARESAIWAIYPWTLEAREMAGRLLDAGWPRQDNIAPLPSPAIARGLEAMNAYLAALDDDPDEEVPVVSPSSVSTRTSPRSLVTAVVEVGWARTLFMRGDWVEADLFCTNGARRAVEAGWTMLYACALMSRLPIVAALKSREGLATSLAELRRLAGQMRSPMLLDWAQLWTAAARSAPDASALAQLAVGGTAPSRALARAWVRGVSPERGYARSCYRAACASWSGRTLKLITETPGVWAAAWVLDVVGKRLVSPSGEVLNLSRQQIGIRILATAAAAAAPITKEAMATEVWELSDYHPGRDDNRMHVSINRVRRYLARLDGADALLHTSATGYSLRSETGIVVVLPA